ncbi:Na+/H+ antiporter subunit C [Brevibacterium sp. HMSC08F02]|uniref:Na(+)/H(+) antiporter subunit C1 n=1 Tax=Brevibacterium ravenspurgense TaxID=479117 RepID=A0A150H878_9MICO|nr:Na(+)/H(+) antiporter subunit C1 [Brevibacterium ravenspurgense]OFT25563.1 Na+/H+ antiporter subunit C [Brevibacterium sp. HMSC08F02]OFT94661.1 Na+/H+ antiporter subunit C [Brevibacterium sp. HMSC24B04]OFT96961.1 Na+/H+ antiporter subunit C [Brevibacterium sp. HMSC22B09]PKY71275.1 Na+/H+ antiporter subunit C [Brevibacterium ravenspurgense]
MILSITIGILTAGGVYLMMQRSMVRAVFGLALVSHAANFALLASGVSAWRHEPLGGRSLPADAADPLPQAFVLTAIVITLAVTIFMLALAVLGHDDDQKTIPETGEIREGDVTEDELLSDSALAEVKQGLREGEA